jgi:Cu(I)/Ag(I) efflux system membrane fusion protein
VNGTFSIDAAAQLAGKPSMMNPEGVVAMTAHKHSGSSNSKIGKTSSSSQESGISDEAKRAIEPLFNNYFKMKVALSNDDFEKAIEAGIAMKTALEKIDMKIFKGDAHLLWMQESTSLKENLQHINHLGDIKVVREKFIIISNSMITIAESFDPLSTTIYVQHCPMADSNKGADWLSNVKKIQNPYFGEAMFSCGETTKTIK